MTNDEYADFQWRLLRLPEQGDVIPNGGGVRKIRYGAKSRGKRGGARVIYYLAFGAGVIFLLDIYAKNEKQNLSVSELKTLKNTVEEWLRDG